MGWWEATPASPLLLGLFAFLVLVLTANTQDPCASPNTISIAFPELPEGSTPSPTDTRFTQTVLSTSVEPFSFEIRNVTESQRNFNEYFSYRFNNFGSSLGVVVDVIKGLDRDGPTSVVIDDLNILQYQIVCQATASSLNVFRVLNIQIQDQNDNAPQFVGAPYRFNVNELTPVGVTVYRLISTNDLDEGDNKQVEYFFERSPTAQFDGTSYFELPSVQEGLVAVRRALDFEPMYRATNGDAALTFYNLTLFARDKGIPAQTSSTYMVITITDGDDLGPEFQYSTCLPSQIADGKSCVRPDYRSTIESDSNQGSTLVFTPVPVDPNNPTATTEIIIQDRDSLNNGVRCQVVSTVPAGYQDRFLAVSSRISGSEKQHRCTIFHLSNQAISHSAVPQLDLILLIQELSDQGRIDYATVQVSVIQANNFDPVLAASSNTGWVLENSPTAMLGLTLVHAWVCGCVFLV